MHFSIPLLSFVLANTATAMPYFQHGQQDTSASTAEWTKLSDSNASPLGRMAIKRSPEDETLHPVVRQIQKVNHAYNRHAARLAGPSAPRNFKRDGDAFEFVPLRLAKRKDGHGRAGRNRGGRKQRAGNNQDDTQGSDNGDDATPVDTNAAARATQTGALIAQKFTPADKPDNAQTIAVNDDGRDITYFGELTVGSNKKPFLVVLDTGSSDLWVPAIGSTQTHSTLARGDSKTLTVFDDKPFQITYGSGQVAGVLVADTVNFAGFTLNTTFGASTFVSNDFDNFIPDGILGLATTKASAEKVTVPVQQLADAKVIPNALFGVHLQRAGETNDGAITIGSTDEKFISGNVTFSDNISAQGLWEIKLEDMAVNGKSLGLSAATTSIVDTGTTLLIVPPQDAITIHSALSAEAATNNQGSFTIPCDTTTPLTVTFAGSTFTISPKDYVGAANPKGSTTCMSNIIGQQIGGQNQMLFGDVFLKNVYSVFDLEKNQVGLAVDAVNNKQ